MKSTLIALCITLTAAFSAQAQTTLRIRGSDTLGAKLVPSLAEAFKKQGGKVSFDIAAEGSSTAFTNLAAGTAEIGMSSRKIKADERTLCRSKGIAINEIEIAWDMITVVVNKNNPITDLKKKHVMQIFAGDIKDWSELGGSPGPISVYTRNTSSGTYKDFMTMAMKGREYGSNSQKMAGNEQIVSEVSSNANGIGYVGYAYAGASGIKVVSIDGAFPNPAAVKSYVLARPTFLYTSGEPSGTIKEFIDFCRGAAGDAIISKTGFVPLSQMK
ncbi:MAG: PstS family phosphate ABC transporter substrate-binding protein [Prosthecobacter sp.]|jgi:phosphate transport system substrate-binding protein|uniref:PstS family phosphate ABC transporter substrate-binding protein n=1 Tax=Prosthecobacter sp. TaxID=1965333 RepID=UPI0019FD74A9|nr:PstS family phosphate ABC transporter substrate-binding protein [Prosthecobacter sp.]MBE2284281.1 PstS family phosphate ABC transporter substrate-binding protein [Prosthecobacter sp.]